MSIICLATNNEHKVREFSPAIENTAFDLTPQSDFGITSAKENGMTFLENALIKARHACTFARMPAVADDSGLIVDALDGAPGLYSARYAGQHATDTENLQKLIHELQPHQEMVLTARFVCYLVLIRSVADPAPIILNGTWEGLITLEPRGENGFGYDPVFYLQDLDKTAAELTESEKFQLSHRGQALQALNQYLKTHDSL